MRSKTLRAASMVLQVGVEWSGVEVTGGERGVELK